MYVFYIINSMYVNVSAIGGDLVRGLGGQGRQVSAENFFCRPLQNVKFEGDNGGLTVFVNFNI